MLPTAPFGRTGHISTRVIFGAAALGGMSQERADATLAAVAGWGINHIDTAASSGASEVVRTRQIFWQRRLERLRAVMRQLSGLGTPQR
jgi:aryl-alcohol dehydrogenase-like predicted oxidoreductase